MKKTRLETMEFGVILGLGLLLVLVASMPYLAGYADCPDNAKFLWMTFNSDDFCVYLSWVRQVADGSILMENLFTNQQQPSMQFNLFFAVAGLISRLTSLTPLVVLHLLRVILGVSLILAVWKLSRIFFKDCRERIITAALFGFSSGFGWMFSDKKNVNVLPVDRWQPESLAFLSTYLNPLFLVSLLLIVGVVYHLVQIQRYSAVKNAVWAGLLLLILGNVHTYDLVPIGMGWGIYLAYLVMVRDRGVMRKVILSLVAGVIALPTVAYQFHVYHSDEVFRLRANTAASSPAIWCFFLGYGLVFIMACVGASLAVRKRDHLVLVFWVIACLVSAYLPFAQQRKFIMGMQIPLVMLSVMAFSALLRRGEWRNWAALTLLLVTASMPMNSLFISRDTHWLVDNKTAPGLRAYLSGDEWKALQWIRQNVGAEESVFCGPDPSAFVPAFAGKHVYCGHWSETPDFKTKVNEWLSFIDPRFPDSWREELLRSRGIKYVWYQDYSDDPDINEFRMLPTMDGIPFLKLAYRSGTTVIYRYVD